MRSAGNFHPEWRYFAPMPRFRRTLRIAVVAAATGAAAGAVVGVSLLSPLRANLHNTSGPAYALISGTSAIASPAEAVTKTPLAAGDIASPAIASLASDGGRSIKIAQPTDLSMKPLTAAVNPEPDVGWARQRPVRLHRSQLASNALKYSRDEHASLPPYQLPHHSTFVQLHRPCCAWTTPTRRNALGW